MNIKKLALLIPALALLGSCSCSEASLVMADCAEPERSAKVKRAPVVSSSVYPQEWEYLSMQQAIDESFLRSIPVGVSTVGIDVAGYRDIFKTYDFYMPDTSATYYFGVEFVGVFQVWDYNLRGADDYNLACDEIDVRCIWQYDESKGEWVDHLTIYVWTGNPNEERSRAREDMLFYASDVSSLQTSSNVTYMNCPKLEQETGLLIRDMSENCPEGTFSGRYNWASVFSQVSTASCLIPQETPYSGSYITGWWFYSNKEQPFVNLHADMVDLKAGSKISKEGQAVTTATDDQYKFIRAVYGIRSDNTKVKIAEYNPNYYYPLGGGAWSISTDIADDLWVVGENYLPFLGVGSCMNENLNPDTGLYMDAYPNHDQALVSPWDYLFNRAGGNVYEPWTPDLDWNKGQTVNTENAVSSTFNLLGFAFGSMLPILSIQVMPGISLWVFLILPLVATIVVLIFKAVKK